MCNLKKVAGYVSASTIGFVCAMDNVISYLTSNTLPDMEQNPVAMSIIEHGGVVHLIELKAIGAVLAVVLSLVVIRTKFAVSVHVVAALQVVLLSYLLFEDSRPNRCLLMPTAILQFYTGSTPESTPFERGERLSTMEWEQRGVRWMEDGSRLKRSHE